MARMRSLADAIAGDDDDDDDDVEDDPGGPDVDADANADANVRSCWLVRSRTMSDDPRPDPSEGDRS